MKCWLSILIFCFASSLSCYSQYRDTTIVDYVKVDSGDFNPFGAYDCYQVLRTYSKKGKLKKEVYDNWNGNRAWVNYFGKKKIVRRKYKGIWARNELLPCMIFENIQDDNFPWVNSYDTIDINNVSVVYTSNEGKKNLFSFNSDDSLIINNLSGNLEVSRDQSGRSEYYLFYNNEEPMPSFYNKVFTPDSIINSNEYKDTCALRKDIYMSYWSYKDIVQLNAVGFKGGYFALKNDSILLDNKITLEDCSLLFPNSYRTALDTSTSLGKWNQGLTAYYQVINEANEICNQDETTYFEIHLRTNMCEGVDQRYDYDTDYSCSHWKLIFKNKRLWSVVHVIGT